MQLQCLAPCCVSIIQCVTPAGLFPPPVNGDRLHSVDRVCQQQHLTTAASYFLRWLRLATFLAAWGCSRCSNWHSAASP